MNQPPTPSRTNSLFSSSSHLTCLHLSGLFQLLPRDVQPSAGHRGCWLRSSHRDRHTLGACCNILLWSRSRVHTLQFKQSVILSRQKKQQRVKYERNHRERSNAANARTISESLLVLVHWTGIWIGHTQGERSHLSPRETNLMDSGAKRLMGWPGMLGGALVKGFAERKHTDLVRNSRKQYIDLHFCEVSQIDDFHFQAPDSKRP